MKFIRAIGFCHCCRQDVLILRRAPLHARHLLISLLSAGLWVPLWLQATRRTRIWRCSQCGRVVLNGPITPLPAQAEPPLRPLARRQSHDPAAVPGSFNHKLVFQGLVYYMPTCSLLH